MNININMNNQFSLSLLILLLLVLPSQADNHLSTNINSDVQDHQDPDSPPPLPTDPQFQNKNHKLGSGKHRRLLQEAIKPYTDFQEILLQSGSGRVIDIEKSNDDSIVAVVIPNFQLIILAFDGTQYNKKQVFQGGFYDSDMSGDGKWIVGVKPKDSFTLYHYNEATDLYEVFQEITITEYIYGIEITDDHQKIVAGAHVYKFNGSSFELHQNLSSGETVYFISLSKDEKWLFLDFNSSLSMFKYNGNSYDFDSNFTINGQKKLSLSEDSKYLVFGNWHSSQIGILKFNEASQKYEQILRKTMSSNTFGCSLSSDKRFLIATTSVKTYLYSFHEEAGQVTLNELQSYQFTTYVSVLTRNQKFWILSDFGLDDNGQYRTAIYIYKEACARQNSLYYEISTSTCQECTGANEEKCLSDGSVGEVDDGSAAFLCQIHGCHECSSTNFCEICEDATAHPNDQGQCVCNIFFEKINPSGKCEPCFVAGCDSCAEGQNKTCVSASDSMMTIENGMTVCPQNSYINIDGPCDTCNVPGCKQCSVDDPSLCLECVDSTDLMVLSDDKTSCNCLGNHEKPNPFGHCEYCFVDGCASCSFTAYMCRLCIDPSAQLVDGLCQCPEGSKMNSDGLCETCDIAHCQKCVDGDSSQCQVCSHPYMLDNSNICVCPQGDRVDTEGECVPCSDHCVDCHTSQDDGSQICNRCDQISLLVDGVCNSCNLPGCDVCSTFDSCSQCLNEEEIISIDSQCICRNLDMKPNSEDTCSECDVYGCTSCDAQDSAKCFMSIDGEATIEEGVVKCPENQRLDSQGMCTTCMVIGCYECIEDNPNVCAQCTDLRGATLSEDKSECNCKNEFMQPGIDGMCSFCAVEGCASCGRIVDECLECEAPRELDEFKQCVMPESE